MQQTQVQSSVVASIAYDEKSKCLEVHLVNGTVYEYYKVPADVFTSFLDAESKGTFYNKVVKQFAYRKLR